ncbi:MAG: hypothetical protein GX028_03305 [Clostridiaceae bacterium]|nr:hypothetical protein [Clostridiaceae bacterium]
MMDWWQSMNIFQQVMALFALPATAVLIIQTLLLLFGFGHDGGADAPDGGIDLTDSDVMTGDADISGDIADTAGDSDGWMSEGDVDFDSGLRLLTVRGMVAFFAVGGWVGIAAVDLGAVVWAAALAAVVAGLIALWLVAVIFKTLMRLQSSGNVNLNNAVGAIGEVYLRIPPAMQGQGKVSVQVQERLIEAAAMTKAEEELKSGTSIRVLAVRGSNLLVEPVDNK